MEALTSQAVKPLDTPERSDVITAKDLETLAIVGRDATELIRMLPGFALVSPGLNNQAPNDAGGGREQRVQRAATPRTGPAQQASPPSWTAYR